MATRRRNPGGRGPQAAERPNPPRVRAPMSRRASLPRPRTQVPIHITDRAHPALPRAGGVTNPRPHSAPVSPRPGP